MYPGGTKSASGRGQGQILQGLPVAIGSERSSFYSDDHESSASNGTRSGGSSPGSDGSRSFGGNERGGNSSRRSSGSSRMSGHGSRRYRY